MTKNKKTYKINLKQVVYKLNVTRYDAQKTDAGLVFGKRRYLGGPIFPLCRNVGQISAGQRPVANTV